MKQKRIISFLLIVLLLFIGVNSIVQASEEKTVQVKGEAPIIDGNAVAARRKAVNDGLRRAVEKVVGTYISSSTRMENAQLIEDKILKSSQGYVKNHEILNKEINGDIYVVQLKVTVSERDVTNDLEALELNIKRHGNPRVMLLLNQDDYDIDSSSLAVENKILNKFIESGYDVIDRQRMEEIIDREKKKAIIGGNYELAVKLANELKADLVIVGTARASQISLGDVYDQDLGSQIKSYRGSISLKVVNASTARVIATANGEEKGIGGNREEAVGKALEKASNKAVDKLIDQVSESLIQEEKVINLKISGIESLTQLQQLRDKLPRVSQVKNVYFREYNDGMAIFDLDTEGAGEMLDLAASLEEKVSFNFKILSMTDSKIILEVK